MKELPIAEIERGTAADNLGRIHERSVGDIRKSKGVYYTPKYIVDYIVRKAIGRLLEAPASPIDAARLTILDPACGCGAFLLGAYEYLLEWHLNWYVANDSQRFIEGKHAALKHCENGQWQLTIHERKRILLTNIFGVDIDAKAVEIARHSLSLKMLEADPVAPPGETRPDFVSVSKRSISNRRRSPRYAEEPGFSPHNPALRCTSEAGVTLLRPSFVASEQSLLDLSRNIQVGNSLVGPDLFLSDAAAAMPSDERAVINAFDWQRAFPDVFNAGGFRVVLGNPPYLNGIEKRTRYGEILNEYFRSKYASAKGAIDASILFQELSLNCLQPGGLTSMIVPNKFLSAPFGAAYRDLVSKSAEIRLLADFSKTDIFNGAATYPVVYVLEKIAHPRKQYSIDLEIHQAGDQAAAPLKRASVAMNPAKLKTWSQLFSFGQGLLDRLARDCTPLGDVYEVAASATAAEAYVFKEYIRDDKPEAAHFQFVTSGAIDRYSHAHGLTPMRYLKSIFQHPHLPATCEHLSNKRRRQYSSEKLIFAGMTKRLEAIWDSGQLAGSVPTVQVLTTAASPYNLKFVLGIMNSSLIDWIFNQYFASLALSGGYLRIGVPQIRTLPLPKLDLSNVDDKSRHDRLVALVETMLVLQVKRRNSQIANERESVDRQIAAYDFEIDEFVNQLFAITVDERIQIAGETENLVTHSRSIRDIAAKTRRLEGDEEVLDLRKSLE